MGIRIGPNAETSNTILFLDAKNPISYNGAGSIWYDLSGNGNHFSLEGNPVHSLTNGRIYFNQTGNNLNQYAYCTNQTCGDFGKNDFTIELVMELPLSQGTSGMAIISNRNKVTEAYGDSEKGFSVGIVNQASFRDNGKIANSPNSLFSISQDQPISGSVTHHVYTIKRGGTDSLEVTASLYKNGSLYVRPNPWVNPIMYTLGNTDGGTYPTADGKIDGSFVLKLMSTDGQNGPFASGSLLCVKLYNKTLTSTEVAKNYTLYKNYYGF